MASVSSLGSGSGLDLSGLLTQLMTAEQIPLTALQKKEASYQANISAFGTLSSALSSLQSAASSLIPTSGTTAANMYQTYSASVADSTIASATAKSGAVAGSYSLEVSSLAQSQRLVTPAYSGGSASTAIDTGTLKIELGSLSGSTFTADSTRTLSITVDSSNATLGGLRDAINAAKGGVSATIVNGSSGAQLVLTSTSTGTANVMRLSGLNNFDYDPETDAGTLTQNTASGGQAAADAAFTLNGIAGTSSTNTVSNMLDGVTLTLLKKTSGTATTLTVSKETSSALSSALNSFVKSYNDAFSTISSLGAYDSKTKTAGQLQGNSALRSVQTQLRNLVFNTTSGNTSTIQRLSDIGVSFAKDGTLSLDSTKLQKAVSKDFDSVANLVSNVGTAFKKGVDGMVGTTGTVTAATDSLNRMIKMTQAQEQTLSDRLTTIEARYRSQFTSLDTLIAGMKQTSNYLTQQLANLSSSSSN